MTSKNTIRVLTVSDLHQSRLLYDCLARAVAEHRPDVLAVVGDALDALTYSPELMLATAECAKMLAALPVEHLVFVRGNHEDANWTEFVAAWPHEQRPLVALYGSSIPVGPLVIVGFPCLTGSEYSWCAHLCAKNNHMELAPSKHRDEMPIEFELWLPQLMRQVGPAARALWLLHEPPVAKQLASDHLSNPEWRAAIERYQPHVTVSGHDHITPLKSKRWNSHIGNTICVNVGQGSSELHYCLLDFEFEGETSALPLKVTLQAFPWSEKPLVT